VSTLRSLKTMTQFFLFFSIKPAMLLASMLGDYSTRASSTPSCFPLSHQPVGKSVSHHITTRPSSLLFLFWIIIPAILPTTMLGYYSMSASLTPSEFFSSLFRSIGSLPPIGHHSTSLRSAQTTKRSAVKLICSFLFGSTCMLFDLLITLRLHHDLSMVAAPTPRSGACETWVPLGPHRPGSQPSSTSGSGLPEDLPTCQWAQLT
jgi:hypothetical protein